MEKITRIESFIKLRTINWILLIFSTTLLFFSIQTYNIFPKITSDTPQLQKRNLEEKITENCLSAITSIEFIDYSNLTINYSEYKYLGIYQPFHKYEHKKQLSKVLILIYIQIIQLKKDIKQEKYQIKIKNYIFIIIKL